MDYSGHWKEGFGICTLLYGGRYSILDGIRLGSGCQVFTGNYPVERMVIKNKDLELKLTELQNILEKAKKGEITLEDLKEEQVLDEMPF